MKWDKVTENRQRFFMKIHVFARKKTTKMVRNEMLNASRGGCAHEAHKIKERLKHPFGIFCLRTFVKSALDKFFFKNQ